MQNRDFYIGWQDRAPKQLTRFIQKYLLLLAIILAMIASLLAAKQKKFSTATFEFGKLSTIHGVYGWAPIPHLMVMRNGDSYFIPLVGYGKHGADGIMRELETAQHKKLDRKLLSLRGTLLYGDGKMLMQVDNQDSIPLLSVSPAGTGMNLTATDLGKQVLNGEVIDPKCYFGVMKPGEGKVHKDCAIRCIAGGIPPVLMTLDEAGNRDYILLVGASGEAINDRVLDYVAVPSRVTGHVYQYGDWKLIRVDEITHS